MPYDRVSLGLQATLLITLSPKRLQTLTKYPRGGFDINQRRYRACRLRTGSRQSDHDGGLAPTGKKECNPVLRGVQRSARIDLKLLGGDESQEKNATSQKTAL